MNTDNELLNAALAWADFSGTPEQRQLLIRNEKKIPLTRITESVDHVAARILANAVVDLKKQVAFKAGLQSVSEPTPSSLTWTNEKPTQPGWYWHKDACEHPQCVRIVQWLTGSCSWIKKGELCIDHGLSSWTLLRDFEGQFAGPIPEPT